jgi:DNA replication protein DnaC
LRALFNASGLSARAKERTLGKLDRSKAHPAGLKAVEGWEYGALGLFLHGDNGVGKTYLAHCLAMRELVKHSRRIRWWNVPVLLMDIKGGFKLSTAKDVIDQALNIPLLFLDDLGVENSTSWARETLFVILDGRLEARRPLIITSNLDLPGLETAMGRRIADRIPEACTVVEMRGPSLRTGEQKMGVVPSRQLQLPPPSLRTDDQKMEELF